MIYSDIYQTCNRKWGDFEDEYYIMLNAVDRLKGLLEDKYGSLYKASQAIGYHPAYLTKQLSTLCACPRVLTINRLCKHLDISLNFAILGHGSAQYTECTCTFNNFVHLYKSRYFGKHHRSLDVATSRMRKGEIKNIPLKYLIRIATEQKVTIDWLIGG